MITLNSAFPRLRVPIAGFLIDVLKSQKKVDITLVFLGARHISNLAKLLEIAEYKLGHQEGTIFLEKPPLGDRKLTVLNKFNESDTPVNALALKKRLNEFLLKPEQ